MRNLNNVETFILVAETKSFTRAAKARRISRAAASKHVMQLEEELGVALLLRSTRDVALTEEGQLVYEECRQIMENVAEVDALLAGLKEEPTGQLSIVSGPVFAHKYILPYLPEFFKKYPKINLKLDFRHLMPQMREEKIDVVVGVFGAGPPDAIQTAVIMTRRVFCATPDYLQKFGIPKNPEDLLKHALIIHPIAPGSSTLELKKGKQVNAVPKILVNDQLAIRQCVLNGLGIGMMQAHVIEQELQNGTLVELLSDYMESKNTIPIHLYYLQRRHLHSKIRLFVDFIKNNVRKS
ncbi:MAG: LysR family transcriptional regulator [Parachlamydia sp.]|nr:LysR family transcriptional regulator [Parachlamydia sp.]